jgi:uncharacterized protein YukE
MPDWLRVVPEDLHVSAATVDVHADDVQVRHSTADGRIEAAQVGLPTGSAAALSSAVAKWQVNTTALFGRMVDHSAGLRAGATLYQQTDTDGESEIETAAAAISPDDMGL